MSYHSRSDFMFNIRDFAESLHIDDIKALNEGIGLGDVRKSERGPQPHARQQQKSQATHELPDPSREVQVSVRPQAQPQGLPNNARMPKRPLFVWPSVLNRFFARVGAHALDLVFLASVTFSLYLLVKRIAQLQGVTTFDRLFNLVENIRNLPLLHGVGVSVGSLYLLFVLFWICFRIVGLKTPGELLLVKEPKLSANGRN